MPARVSLLMKALRFSPILKQTLWGGEDIAALKHLDHAPEQVGESWEIADFEAGATPVAEGEYEGRTLSWLIGQHGTALLGKRNFERFGTRFPLLIKFLNPARDLSIQVHPDDALAHTLGHAYGKTEMWHIVTAEPGAKLFLGFNRPLSPACFAEAVREGRLLDFLQTFHPEAGDTFYVPAGCIHSIGAGLLLVEVQQASDDTFRVYDYDRTDAQGNKRQLHIDMAQRALRYEPFAEGVVHPAPACGAAGAPAHGECFTTTVHRLATPHRIDCAQTDYFRIFVAFQGEARLCYDEGETSLHAGETLLFPASTQRIDLIPGAEGFGALEVFIED